MAYVDLRIDGEGQVLSVDHYAKVPGPLRRQLDGVDTITLLMGLDASAELLYSYTLDGCAIREVVLGALIPPVKARCSLLKSSAKHEILCRLAFVDGIEQ
jgi:hypothetical protein